jgi:hypothetical protein
MGAILQSDPNNRQLGAIPAGGEVRVRLDWFPLTSGVQKNRRYPDRGRYLGIHN